MTASDSTDRVRTDAVLHDILNRSNRTSFDLERLAGLSETMEKKNMKKFARKYRFEFDDVMQNFMAYLFSYLPKYDSRRQRGDVFVRWIAGIARMRMRANLPLAHRDRPKFQGAFTLDPESGEKIQRGPILAAVDLPSNLEVYRRKYTEGEFKKDVVGDDVAIELRQDLREVSRTPLEWAIIRKSLYGFDLTEDERFLLSTNSRLLQVLLQNANADDREETIGALPDGTAIGSCEAIPYSTAHGGGDLRAWA